MGKPSTAVAAPTISKLDPLYPSSNATLNRELSALLVYLEAPGAVSRTVKLLESSPLQEEQIWCAYVLRTAQSGWASLAERKAYFDWFHRAVEFKGGHSFAPYLQHMKNEAISHLSADDKLAVVSFGRTAAIDQVPQQGVFGGFVTEVSGDASNLAEGLNTALGLVPRDGSGRILVLSDGRWTGQDPASGIPSAVTSRPSSTTVPAAIPMTPIGS